MPKVKPQPRLRPDVRQADPHTIEFSNGTAKPLILIVEDEVDLVTPSNITWRKKGFDHQCD